MTSAQRMRAWWAEFIGTALLTGVVKLSIGTGNILATMAIGKTIHPSTRAPSKSLHPNHDLYILVRHAFRCIVFVYKRGECASGPGINQLSLHQKKLPFTRGAGGVGHFLLCRMCSPHPPLLTKQTNKKQVSH